jgi:hypothetical protein
MPLGQKIKEIWAKNKLSQGRHPKNSFCEREMCGSAKSLKDHQVYSHLWEFEVSMCPTILEQGSNFVQIGLLKKLLDQNGDKYSNVNLNSCTILASN